MTIKVGDRLPEGKLTEATEFDTAAGCPLNPQDISVTEATKGKKIVIFGVPGAYTPTCSAKHVPSYVANYDKLKAKGVDEIWCVAVNDAFVMGAWGRDAEGRRQGAHARRRQRRVHQEARPRTRPHRARTWACARSAIRCWSQDGVVKQLERRGARASSRSRAQKRCSRSSDYSATSAAA